MSNLAEAMAVAEPDAPPAHAAQAHASAGPARSAAPRAMVAGAVRWADLALLALAFLGAGQVFLDAGLWNAPLGAALPWIAAPAIVAWCLGVCRAYEFHASESAGAHGAVVGVGALTGALGAWAVAALAAAGGAPSQGPAVLSVGVLLAAILVLTHEGWRILLSALSRSGRLAHNVVIVGATANAERLIEANARTGEINVMAVFDDRTASGRAPAAIGGAPVLGAVDDLLAWPDLPRAECIIITVTSLAAERTRALIEQLRPLPNKVVLFLDIERFRPEASNLARIADLPMAYVSGAPQAPGRMIAKRVQDVVLAGVALAAFAPVMAAIALAVRLDSPGPILFRQKRHGFNNRIIEVLKFRTMRADAGQGPTRQVVADDPRVTRIGRILRSTSLDELPQLFNVLAGQMSMVGPRPHAIDMKTGEVESARLVADYAHRCRVKPGITGWAQIHGSRGPVHTPEEVEERVRYDIDYIQNQSLLLDLWILICTAPCLLGDALKTR